MLKISVVGLFLALAIGCGKKDGDSGTPPGPVPVQCPVGQVPDGAGGCVVVPTGCQPGVQCGGGGPAVFEAFVSVNPDIIREYLKNRGICDIPGFYTFSTGFNQYKCSNWGTQIRLVITRNASATPSPYAWQQSNIYTQIFIAPYGNFANFGGYPLNQTPMTMSPINGSVNFELREYGTPTTAGYPGTTYGGYLRIKSLNAPSLDVQQFNFEMTYKDMGLMGSGTADRR